MNDATAATVLTESQLRHRAAKQGYLLRKDRARTWRWDRQGGWMIVDADRNFIVAGEHFEMTDEDVAAFLADA